MLWINLYKNTIHLPSTLCENPASHIHFVTCVHKFTEWNTWSEGQWKYCFMVQIYHQKSLKRIKNILTIQSIKYNWHLLENMFRRPRGHGNDLTVSLSVGLWRLRLITDEHRLWCRANYIETNLISLFIDDMYFKKIIKKLTYDYL